jgi:serine/threonine-protein kinase HipA
MSRALNVWYRDRKVGRLLDSGGGRMAFIYDGNWLEDGWAISCSLPVEETGDFLPPDLRGHHFFANLLPEGNARDRLVRQLGIADDDFTLLEKLGGDCAGALQLLPEGDSPNTDGNALRVLTQADLITAIERGRANWLDGDTAPRLSLAGAQDKIPVRATANCDGTWHLQLPEDGAASTHILKLPVRDLKQVPLLEIYTTYIAEKLGLPVAPVRLVRIGPHIASLAERYDRQTHDGVVDRLHQEDFCQAQGLSHNAKYEAGDNAVAKVAAAIQKHCLRPALDLQAFARWQVFNALTGNADGHLKNLSLISHGRKGWSLAPFYDLVCTLAIDNISHQLALPVGSHNDPGNLHRKHWDVFADQLGMAPKYIHRLIRAQASSLSTNLEAWHRNFIEDHQLTSELDNAQAVIKRQIGKAKRDWLP